MSNRTAKPVTVIDAGWYRKNRVAKQFKAPAAPDAVKTIRPHYQKPEPSPAELALLEWRRANTSEHMRALSETVSALQFGLCADCLQEFKLRAVPKRAVEGPWTSLTAQDVLGVCSPCRKARLKTMEIRCKGRDLLFLAKQ